MSADKQYKPWEGDHRDLVGVLWDCDADGLTLNADFDEIASRIMRSDWLKANKANGYGS